MHSLVNLRAIVVEKDGYKVVIRPALVHADTRFQFFVTHEVPEGSPRDQSTHTVQMSLHTVSARYDVGVRELEQLRQVPFNRFDRFVHDLLYRHQARGGDVYDPHKEWSGADYLNDIAENLEGYIPRPVKVTRV